jgi:two-component system cell cycle response regulator CpdR
LPNYFDVLPGLRILVADDDPQLLEVLAEALEQLGAKVVRAHNGGELIDRLADSGPFDLIVTDIAMPWMTGLSSMRAARTAGLGMPVIVITGLSDEKIPAEVKALGPNAVLLRKPFEMRELESAVEQLLGHQEVRRQ